VLEQFTIGTTGGRVSDLVTIEAHGKKYRIDNPGGRIGSKLETGVPYEIKLLEQIHDLALTGTAFDIGAHVGNHALWLARMCGLNVHAFEPHETMFDALVSNVKRNRLGSKITCHNVAAGDGPGRAEFRDSMTLKLDRGSIPVAAIDDLVDVDDLALVKVDVEGMEPHALRGMRRHLEACHPIVYAESHDERAHQRVAAVLEPLGYEQTSAVMMGSRMELWEWLG
jgi:FkbM family methyltransferase